MTKPTATLRALIEAIGSFPCKVVSRLDGQHTWIKGISLWLGLWAFWSESGSALQWEWNCRAVKLLNCSLLLEMFPVICRDTYKESDLFLMPIRFSEATANRTAQAVLNHIWEFCTFAEKCSINFKQNAVPLQFTTSYLILGGPYDLASGRVTQLTPFVTPLHYLTSIPDFKCCLVWFKENKIILFVTSCISVTVHREFCDTFYS